MFERFTERARQVIVLAQDEARALKHDYIGTEHLLLGVLREEEGVAATILESLDVTIEEVRAQVARIVGIGEAAGTGQIPFTPRAKRVLELALNEALALGHNYVGTEHLLLGLICENGGVAARILLDFDADAEKIRVAVIHALSGPGRRELSRPAPVRSEWLLLERLRRVKEERIDAQDYERASELRDLERTLKKAIDAAAAELPAPPPSVRDGDASRWEYRVETLNGAPEAWPDQLKRWRLEGWEPITVVREEERFRALLERRQ